MAILKAGLVKTTALRFNIQKLHTSSHLYTSNTLITNFDGRCFEIEQVIPFNKKQLKLLTADIKQANITTRNFPFSVEQLRNQLKLKEGGNHYLFATTLLNQEKVLILCHKIKL